MACKTYNVRPNPIHGYTHVLKEYRRLVEDPKNRLPYKEGAGLTLADISVMKIDFDSKANFNFWKRTDLSVKSVLESSLEETFNNSESVLNERNVYKEELTKHECQRITHAYKASTEYSRVLEYLVNENLFQNELLVNPPGEFLFQDLGVGYYGSHIDLECHLVFGTPGHPHITILSIQPQRASSQKELLCTESWTLLYWAQKLARRTLDTTEHCLPIRLVSICGYEARMVSAVFSLGYLRCLVEDMGHGKYGSLKCQIHVAEYRDLSLEQPFRDLLEELVDIPCSSADLQ